jgi:FkbM family methyltransferase
MKVYDYRLGRLGNAIFRYFASSLFVILYKAERTYEKNDCTATFGDTDFISWMNYMLDNKLPVIEQYFNFSFYGFYQHDKIFRKFRNELIQHMQNNPDELIYTDGNDENTFHYRYNVQSYKVSDLITNCNKYYEVVVHIRLEDFIENNDVIHPECLKNVLDKLNNNICFVVNAPKTEIEISYLNYFKNLYNITIESNDMITDFQIMKNAKILICSCSTISWIAAFLSDTVETVYFPNYNNSRLHETFKQPIDNTILYEIKKCTKYDLENFFKSDIKKDPYCSINCKKEPITTRLLDYLKSIENGFYIEAGAFDGITQSNTKFLEEEYNWTGLLVEPSNVFDELKKNRPFNFLVNKCLVSNEYKDDVINGYFNQGLMSGINNFNNSDDNKIVKVECETLTSILDRLQVSKIDFFSLDVEGYEKNVLEGLDFNKYRPTYILIESFENNRLSVFDYLIKNKYIYLENITNYNRIDNPGWSGDHNDYLFKSL